MTTDEARSREAGAASGAASDETRDRDLGTAWRRAGLALGDLGSGIGDSLKSAWAAAGERRPDRPGEGLRRIADLLDRSVETARSAAGSDEARSRVNTSARRAGEQLERAVRLSLAELGRSLERVDPDRAAERRSARHHDSALD
jgi:hypothetical protein